MKLILLISLIAAHFRLNLAAVAQGFLKDPKYPGRCVVDNIILSPGEEMTIQGKCEQIVCHEESYGTFYSCGVIGVPSGYQLGDPIHPNAGYPKCCARKLIPEKLTTSEDKYEKF